MCGCTRDSFCKLAASNKLHTDKTRNENRSTLSTDDIAAFLPTSQQDSAAASELSGGVLFFVFVGCRVQKQNYKIKTHKINKSYDFAY